MLSGCWCEVEGRGGSSSSCSSLLFLLFTVAPLPSLDLHAVSCLRHSSPLASSSIYLPLSHVMAVSGYGFHDYYRGRSGGREVGEDCGRYGGLQRISGSWRAGPEILRAELSIKSLSECRRDKISELSAHQMAVGGSTGRYIRAHIGIWHWYSGIISFQGPAAKGVRGVGGG